MAYQAKVPAFEPDDLSSISRTHTEEGNTMVKSGEGRGRSVEEREESKDGFDACKGMKSPE